MNNMSQFADKLGKEVTTVQEAYSMADVATSFGIGVIYGPDGKPTENRK